MKKIKISLFIILNLFFLLDKVNAQCDNSLQLEMNAASSVVTMNYYGINEKWQNIDKSNNIIIAGNSMSKILLSTVSVIVMIAFVKKFNLKNFGGARNEKN